MIPEPCDPLSVPAPTDWSGDPAPRQDDEQLEVMSSPEPDVPAPSREREDDEGFDHTSSPESGDAHEDDSPTG